MRIDCEKRMSETEEKKRKNETIDMFAIVERMIDMLKRKITIKTGM
jgi:hypothetical protein